MLANFVEFLKSQNKSLNTQKGYQRAVKDYFNWFCEAYDKEPIGIIKQNVEDYRFFLQTSMHQAASTINYKLSCLKKYNEFLVEGGTQKDIVITNNMMIKIRQSLVSPTVISQEDIIQLRQVIFEHGIKRDYALFNLLEYTGVRISEALGVRLTDCDNICQTKVLIIKQFRETIELEIMNSKFNKQRRVFLNDTVISSLNDYIANERNKYKYSNGSEFLFVSNKNPNLDRITVNRLWQKYCSIAKLPNITPRQVRHFFISNAIMERGYTPAQVSIMMGHSNIHSMLRYTSVAKEETEDLHSITKMKVILKGNCKGNNYLNNCIDDCVTCTHFHPHSK